MRQFVKRTDVNLADILLSAIFFWWALWFILPNDLHERANIYDPLFKHVSPQLWGSLMISILVVKLWAIWNCHWKLRACILMLKVGWWTFVSLKIGLINWNGPSWGLIFIVALVAFWRMLQIAATGDKLSQQCLLPLSEEI